MLPVLLLVRPWLQISSSSSSERQKIKQKNQKPRRGGLGLLLHPLLCPRLSPGDEGPASSSSSHPYHGFELQLCHHGGFGDILSQKPGPRYLHGA